MMYKKLYNLLDLDDTHLHITKKIITTTKKHHSSLLNSMQKRNINLQEIINQYAVEHNERVPKNKSQRKMTEEYNDRNEGTIKKKRMQLALSRGRLDIISNLLRSEKRKNTSREESSINDLFSKKKTSRKQLQIAKFNLSDPIEDDQQISKIHYLYSQNADKENRDKSPIYRFKPFELRNENPALNSIRYSTLLRTLNNDRSYQNYQTKLPQIPISRRLENGKGVFKRVQFA